MTFGDRVHPQTPTSSWNACQNESVVFRLALPISGAIVNGGSGEIEKCKGKFVNIRESVDRDKTAIAKVHLEAFGEPEGDMVSQLALELLEDTTAFPMLSLVAEQNHQITGNVIFSSVTIEGGEGVNAYLLAPLAVARSRQRQGIGTQLIQTGMDMLKERRGEIVFVYGDPKYYRRTGFQAGHNIKPPHTLQYPDEAWMAQELVEGILAKTQGRLRCAASLNSPEFW